MTLKNLPEFDRQTLAVVFSSNYRIPTFQREYTWAPENVEALLDDLGDLIEQEHDYYFLGQIVVTQPDVNDSRRAKIVDGQQRLLTLQLLFNYLLRRMMSSNLPNLEFRTEPLKTAIRIPTDDGDFELRIRMSAEGDSVFRSLVNNEPLRRPASAISASQKNLLKAYKQIEDSLGEKDEDYINDLQKGLRERTVLTKLTIGTLGEALEVFEKINHRGVKLGDTDLLKNYLFRALDDTQFDDVSTTWGSISRKVFALKPKRVASLNLLFRSELIARIGVKVAIDGLLSEWDDYLRKPSAEISPLDLVRELPSISEAFCNYSQRKMPDQTNFVAGRALQEFNSVQHLPVLLAGRRLAPDALEILMEIVEQRVLLSLLSNEGPQNFEKIIPSWAKSIRELASTNPNPSKDELTVASAKALEGIDLLWGAYVIRFGQLNYRRDRRKIRYVLARVAGELENVCGRNCNYEELLQRAISLDHIESQTSNRFESEEFLRREFEIEGSNSDSVRALTELQSQSSQWIHSIGNLAPIRQPENSSMSALPPSEKIPYYKLGLVINMLLCPAEVLEIPVESQRRRIMSNLQSAELSLTSWGPKLIEKRMNYLLGLFADSLTHMKPELLNRQERSGRR